MDHNNVYKGFSIAGQDLLIFGVDSIVAQPSKGLFNHPSVFEYGKAIAWFFADVQHDFMGTLSRLKSG